MAKARKSIPKRVKFEVLTEAGYKCGNPTCGRILTLEIHHIVWVKDDGGNESSNLLALCPNCHSLHTRGDIPQEAIRHWKGMLLALNHAFDRESMDLLLFLHRTREDEIWYSGDGILRFARLLAAGLVELANPLQQYGWCFESILAKPSVSVHQVRLTDAGIQLMEAWLSGDEKAYLKWVSQPYKVVQGG
jgi:hypothetical protein